MTTAKVTPVLLGLSKGLAGKWGSAAAMQKHLEKAKAQVHERHLREVFNKLDRGLTGGVTESDLRFGLSQIVGRDVEEWEFKKMLKQIDKDGNGIIEFDEFCLGYSTLMTRVEQKAIDKIMIAFTRIRHPCEPQRILWDRCLGIILVYSLMMIPFRVCLNLPAAVFGLWWWSDVTIDFYFLMDIVLNFRTGFLDGETGIFIKSPKRIAQEYLRMWFWIDLFTSLPTTAVIEAVLPFTSLPASDWAASIPRVLRIARIVRLVKLLRLAKLAKMVQSSWTSSDDAIATVGKLGKLLFTIFFLAHICGCVFCFTNFGVVDDDDHLPISGWIAKTSVVGYSEEWPLLEGDVDKYWVYWLAVYWSFTTLTTVGYGDISPQSSLEVLWTIVVMYLGACAFGYIVGSVTSIIMKEDKVQVMMAEKIEHISAYMSLRRLPQGLQLRVKEYYNSMWKQKTVFDENAILRELPSFLREEIVGAAYERLVDDVPMLHNLPVSHLTHLVMRLAPQQVLATQTVVRRGELGDSMYIVSEGLLRVHFSDMYADGAVDLLTGAIDVVPGLGHVSDAVSEYTSARLREAGEIPHYFRKCSVVDYALWTLLSPQQRAELTTFDIENGGKRVWKGHTGSHGARLWLLDNIDSISHDRSTREIILRIAKTTHDDDEHDALFSVLSSAKGRAHSGIERAESGGSHLAARHRQRMKRQHRTDGEKPAASLADTMARKFRNKSKGRFALGTGALQAEGANMHAESESGGKSLAHLLMQSRGATAFGAPRSSSPSSGMMAITMPEGDTDAEGGVEASGDDAYGIELSDDEAQESAAATKASGAVLKQRIANAARRLLSRDHTGKLPGFLRGMLTEKLWSGLSHAQRVYLKGIEAQCCGQRFSNQFGVLALGGTVGLLPGTASQTSIRYSECDEAIDPISGMPSFLGRGDFFAHYCVLSADEVGWEHPYTVVSQRSSLLLAITRDEFNECVRFCPDLVELLAENVEAVQKARVRDPTLHAASPKDSPKTTNTRTGKGGRMTRTKSFVFRADDISSIREAKEGESTKKKTKNMEGRTSIATKKAPAKASASGGAASAASAALQAQVNDIAARTASIEGLLRELIAKQ